MRPIQNCGAWSTHVVRDKRCSILLYFIWAVEHQDFYAANVVVLGEGNDIRTYISGHEKSLTSCFLSKALGYKSKYDFQNSNRDYFFEGGWEKWHKSFPCVLNVSCPRNMDYWTVKSLCEKKKKGEVKLRRKTDDSIFDSSKEEERKKIGRGEWAHNSKSWLWIQQ